MPACQNVRIKSRASPASSGKIRLLVYWILSTKEFSKIFWEEIGHPENSDANHENFGIAEKHQIKYD